MFLELQIFGFRAMWSPYFLIFLILVGIVYYLVTGPYRHRFTDDADLPSMKQRVYFYIALILVYIAKGSPIDLMSHIMLTAHMIQMAVFLVITPIFFIKALPKWVWNKIISAPLVGNGLMFLTKPIISLLIFNGLFSLYHMPFVFNFSKSSPIAHMVIHLLLFIAAFIMWLPTLAPVEKMDRLTPLMKVGLIFANSVLITPACVLIIFAPDPLYAAYTHDGAWLTALSLCVPTDVLSGIATSLSGPEMFSPLSIMNDQQMGGIIMKVVQEIAYGSVLGQILFSWFKKDNEKIDPLPSKPFEY